MILSRRNDRHPAPGQEYFTPSRSPFSWLLEREVVRYLKIWRYAVARPAPPAASVRVRLRLALGHRVTGAITSPTATSFAGLLAQRR